MLVQIGNQVGGAIQASTELAKATDVQAKLKDWQSANTNLDANNKTKHDAKVTFDAAVAAQGPLVRRWGIRRRALISAIEVYGDGSAALIQALNVQVAQHNPAPQATVPVNLRAMKKRVPTNACVRWDPTPGATGYMLQHSTNPNDPTTFSAEIHVSASKYDLAGQAPGATIYFRVLALDERLLNGRTAYTAWEPAIVPL